MQVVLFVRVHQCRSQKQFPSAEWYTYLVGVADSPSSRSVIVEVGRSSEIMDDPPEFDLDSYAARYHGRGKIMRLKFIADKSMPLRKDALKLAIIEAKIGKDTALYKDVITQANAQDAHGTDEYEQQEGEPVQLDSLWIREIDRAAAQHGDTLKQELEKSKHENNKEVIRRCHDDLGDFYHKCGKLQLARGEYVKTRDYCALAKYKLQMCMKVITVSVEDADFAHVENHYIMAENTPEADRNSPALSKMRACAGLALLVRGSYAQSAARFLDTCKEKSEDRIATLAKEFGDVMSLEDVATYGSLCALATLDRAALTRMVINRQEFRNLLELVPDVREMVYDFYNTRYTRCLQTMEKIKPDLLYDIHLGRDDHVSILYRLIRRRAIVQYVSPFVSADLVRMSKVFNTTSGELMNELLVLIETDAISARIDTQGQALHAKRRNPRLEAITTALAKGQDSFDDAEALLLRMTLLQNNLQISSSSSSAGGPSLGSRAGSLSSVVDNVFERGFRH